MRIRLGELRRIVRRAVLGEEAWVPGHYYPGAEPLDGPDRDRLNQPLGEEDEDDLDEIYVVESGPPGAGMGADPTKSDDKPYRTEDPYEQLGMHPKATAAGSPPSPGGGEASPAEPADEPTEGT